MLHSASLVERDRKTGYGLESYLRGFPRQKQMEVLLETIYI